MSWGPWTGRRAGVLADILRESGGVYETTAHLPPRAREDIREIAELTSDEELLAIAGLSGVPVSLEHLRDLDPQTRIIIGTRLELAPEDSERLHRPGLGIPLDPRTTVVVEGRDTTAGTANGAMAPSGARPARFLTESEIRGESFTR
jgi:hypothetical protein